MLKTLCFQRVFEGAVFFLPGSRSQIMQKHCVFKGFLNNRKIQVVFFSARGILSQNIGFSKGFGRCGRKKQVFLFCHQPSIGRIPLETNGFASFFLTVRSGFFAVAKTLCFQRVLRYFFSATTLASGPCNTRAWHIIWKPHGRKALSF